MQLPETVAVRLPSTCQVVANADDEEQQQEERSQATPPGRDRGKEGYGYGQFCQRQEQAKEIGKHGRDTEITHGLP